MPRENDDIPRPINLKPPLLTSSPRTLANTFCIDRHTKLFSYAHYGQCLSLDNGILAVNEKKFLFFPVLGLTHHSEN